MASLAPRPTLRAQRFIDANQTWPLEYQSYDPETAITTFRLIDTAPEEDRTHHLTIPDCRSIIDYVPRWRHLCGVGG